MGIGRATIYRLERIRRNLEEGLRADDPMVMEWLCRELKEIVYDVHEELLKRGDEARAIRIFEELYLPFERMERLFGTLLRRESNG